MNMQKLIYTGKAAVAGAGLALAIVGVLSFAIVLPEIVVFASSAIGGAGGAVMGLAESGA